MELHGAPRGTKLHCKGWVQEAAYRMLLNNLDPDVAENPEELVVYGGTGKAARNKKCLQDILSALKILEDDQTLLVQSGKAVGILPSHPGAPRVLIANSNLVGKWSHWDHFHELEKLGLMMYGQMTAGSWIYIGSQGILQGTYETFAACGDKYFSGSLAGKWIYSGGLGGMGGAQPLAATMAGASFLGVDVDVSRIEKRVKTGYLDVMLASLDEALARLEQAKAEAKPISIGLVGNAAEVLSALIAKNIYPPIVTDQTSAHDELAGYVPSAMSLEEALDLRKNNPQEYTARSLKTMAQHVEAMVRCKEKGSIVFDYGNNLREGAKKGGCRVDSYSYQGFVPEFIRPLFCRGSGPFRWAALSGDPKDILVIDEALLEAFPDDKKLHTWMRAAQKKVHFQGLPARICWFAYGERQKAGLIINDLVKTGKVSAPIVIGRDHLDAGSVASPFRETEAMKDKSDAVADWPLLNALINAVNGASWISIHNGGGVGIGYSQHAGMVIVADGTDEAKDKLTRVLNSDPAMGVLRHADAGYEDAIKVAQNTGLAIPSTMFK